MNKLKLNDVVMVHTGSNAGKTGKILKVNRKNSTVVIEGVNEVKKAVKPTQENPQGGFITKLLPLHISNVSLVSSKTNKPSRVKITKDSKGLNQRSLKKCNTVLK